MEEADGGPQRVAEAETCVFIGQVLSWTEQEGRLGSTQPRARAPCPGSSISPGPLSFGDWTQDGEGEAEGADKAEGSAGEGAGTQGGPSPLGQEWGLPRPSSLRWGALLEVYLLATGRQVCRLVSQHLTLSLSWAHQSKGITSTGHLFIKGPCAF